MFHFSNIFHSDVTNLMPFVFGLIKMSFARLKNDSNGMIFGSLGSRYFLNVANER